MLCLYKPKRAERLKGYSMNVQCCVCEKIRHEGTWVLPESIGTVLQGPVSHGYCPECLEKAMEEIRNFQAPAPTVIEPTVRQPLAWAVGL